MIGQDKIIQRIDEYSIVDLPHSILLIGDRGSGQEEIAKYISKRFNLKYNDITENLTAEVLSDFYTSAIFNLCVINLSEISYRDQNILLKSFEEPSQSVYFILYTDNDNKVIDTILTRSYIIKLEKFSTDQLIPLISGNVELTLSLCNTPGQIEIANHTDLEGLYNLCKTIISSMSKATFYNALSISDKINFNDDYSKYDLYLFIKMLSKALIDDPTDTNLNIYKELITMNKYIWTMINKKRYFEYFISQIWSISHEH